MLQIACSSRNAQPVEKFACQSRPSFVARCQDLEVPGKLGHSVLIRKTHSCAPVVGCARMPCVAEVQLLCQHLLCSVSGAGYAAFRSSVVECARMFPREYPRKILTR